jgi:glucose-6-phosphate isomerase
MTALNRLFQPVGCDVDLNTGAMRNATGSYQKRFDDLAGLYGDATAFDEMKRELGQQIVYEVSEFRPSDRAGDIIFGVTRMSPGKVGDEYFITRGHIHKQADRPEIYYGQKGRGLMLMESPEGDVSIVEISPLTCCYVPPFWIHRSVNVGDEDLVMLFCYPSDSGQDYGIIERAGGMRQRIVDDGRGGWKAVDNARWQPRDAATVEALYAAAGEVRA